jgi:DNA-binding NarL/FixJ family response regulator
VERIPVYVHTDDPISQVGVVGQLRPRPEVAVLPAEELSRARVAVVVTDRVTEETLRVLRAFSRGSSLRSILVASQLDESDLVAAVECGTAGMLRRHEATPDRLIAVIASAAAGEGAVPPDLLGRLLEQVGELQRQVLSPRGLTFSGLADREVEVLRLVADGLDTAEIATKLAYSQRTVKNVLHGMTSRLQLKNRSHAVAYALRHGLI